MKSKNNILKAVVYRIVPCLIIISFFVNGQYLDILPICSAEGGEDLVCINPSPFNVTLSINSTPSINETFELKSTVISEYNVSNLEITFELPSGIENVSGNLSWNGSILKNQSKNITVDLKIISPGESIVYCSAIDRSSCHLSFTQHMFFLVNSTTTKIYDFPPRINPNNPIRANLINDSPPANPPGENIIISGSWKYKDNENNTLPIRYAIVKLWREINGTDQLNQTTYTDGSGEFEFDNVVESGKYQVRVYSRTHPNSGHNFVRVTNLNNSDDDLYESDTEWRDLNYSYNTNWTYDYICESYEGNEENGAYRIIWHIYDTIINGCSWLNDNLSWNWENEGNSPLLAKFPEDDYQPVGHEPGGGYFRPLQNGNYYIKISETGDFLWSSDHILHEFGHALMFVLFGEKMPPRSSSEWSRIDELEENLAFTEGWADFMSCVLTGKPYRPNKMGFIPLEDGSLLYDNYESGNYVHHSNGTTTTDDDYITLEAWADINDPDDWDGQYIVGAVASVLWDIYDETDSSDYHYWSEVNLGDSISNLYSLWWDIMDDDSVNFPKNIIDVLDKWNPSTDIWAIYYNQRINNDDTPPPCPDTHTTDIAVNNSVSDNTLEINWDWSTISGEPDDLSGVYGYAVSVTSSPVMPTQVVTHINNDTQLSLSKGSWYVNIRPVDFADNWADCYYSVGPFLIDSNLPELNYSDGMSGKGVTPIEGNESTEFLFKVDYSDKDGNDPIVSEVIIDNYEQLELFGEGCNSTYSGSKKEFSVGKHDYFFRFIDTNQGQTLLPDLDDPPQNFTVFPNNPIVSGLIDVIPILSFPYHIKVNNNEDNPPLYAQIEWGDGKVSDWTLIDITNGHTFNKNWEWSLQKGTFLMNVTVKSDPNNDGNVSDGLESETIQLEINSYFYNFPKVILALLNEYFSGSVGESIQFTADVAGGSAPYNWTWDFGDDTIKYGQNVSHSYSDPGVYTVIMSVEDANGTRDENTTTATIQGVCLTASPNPVLVDEQTNITAHLIGMEPSQNHYYIFSTNQTLQDTNSDGEEAITINFSSPGSYTVSVELRNGSVNGSVLFNDSILIEVIPFLLDAGGPYDGLVCEPINLIGSVYCDNAIAWNAEWDFGDGETATGLNVTHTYDDPIQDTYQNYTVTLSVNIPGEGLVSDTTTARIWNSNYSLPVAILDGPYCGGPGDNIVMDASGSSGDNLTYYWQISGEAWQEGTDELTRVFNPSDRVLPAKYVVRLRVVDEQNFSNTTSSLITISKVHANFHWIPDEPFTNDTVVFHDDSAPEACDTVDYWHWSFGDGTSSSLQNATHVYDDDGYYYVKLTCGSDGKYDTCMKRIHIRNKVPTSSFTLTPRVSAVEDSFKFNSSAADEDGMILMHRWKFGDYYRSYDENDTHQYSDSGLYSIELYVIDDDNDDDTFTVSDGLLIADAIVSSNFTAQTEGWNTTRFSTIPDGIQAVPEDGILVILSGTYSNQNVTINKSMGIYGIYEGYDQGDTSLGYGGVNISGEGNLPLFSISNADVLINGISFQSGKDGVHISNGNLTVKNCEFIECTTGINVSSADDIDISSSEIENNTIGISLNNCTCDQGSIMAMKFEDNNQSIILSDCSNISIIECDMEPTDRGVKMSSSDVISLEYITISSPNMQGINIDNSTNISISNTDIDHTITAIYIGNVSIVNTADALQYRILNNIEDCTFTTTDYGVRLSNADGTRIGGSTWYITHLEAGFPCYFMSGISQEPLSWFTPRNFPEGCMFYSVDYPVYLNGSDYSVIDGVQVLPAFSSMQGDVISAEYAVSLYDSDHTVVHYSKLSNCNQSAIVVNQSDNSTIAFNFLNKNLQGVNLSDSRDSLIIANSFYKNEYTAVNMSTGESVDNLVLYNDFMFNGDTNTMLQISMDSFVQAWDDGDKNSWDDNKTSPWRNWISQFTEIEDDKNQGVGNYWSDYNGTNDTGVPLQYSPVVEGPVPCDFTDFPPDPEDYSSGLPFPPIGNTSYLIPGSADSEDHYPVMRPLWPVGWYNYLESEDISTSSDDVGLGGTMKISANVTDLFHNVTVVRVNISGPDGNWTNESMINIGNDTYQFNFSSTWDTGLYNYTIWASTDNNHTNTSNTSKFWVNASASMSVCTLYNSYTSNASLNLTDPPGGVHNDIGYELLEDGSVLHVWNRFDSYYFNTSSGIQLTNHLDEYWTRNILMLGYYSNDEWNVLYRTDELSGFNKMIDTDDCSYLNATLWKDLTYGTYDFRLGLRYHLGVDDHELTVIPYIKNLGISIPFDLGFAWEVNDVQIDMTPEDDYLLINDTSYWLNETLDLSFTNLTRPILCWNESLNQSEVCGFEPIPYYYIREDLLGGASKSLYLKWNPDVNYKVWIKSRNTSYNAPVVLGMKIGTLDCNQSKQTKLYWYDASEVTYYFDAYSVLEAWASYPAYMVNNNTGNAASTSSDGDSELCNSNSCPSGTDLGTISKVEIRGAGVKSGTHSCSIIFRPSFSGKSGDDHTFTLSTTSSWSDWFDITSDTNAPKDGWTWSDVIGLDCRAIADIPIAFPMPTAYCAKIEVRVTYTSYTPPCISNPSPVNGVTNVSISPTLGITVADDDGDTLSISWLSNCSGSWTSFGSNNSVSNGTYYQTLTGANVNGQWWYWMVNVSDGNTYNESSVFKFYTGTQSKISNTGNTSLSGYLLMQVEYLNGSTWELDSVVINDTTLRTINASSELGLDTVFNGLISVGELVNGDGDYRVYAALRDADGEVLEVDGELLEAWWRFGVNLS